MGRAKRLNVIIIVSNNVNMINFDDAWQENMKQYNLNHITIFGSFTQNINNQSLSIFKKVSI